VANNSKLVLRPLTHLLLGNTVLPVVTCCRDLGMTVRPTSDLTPTQLLKLTGVLIQFCIVL